MTPKLRPDAPGFAQYETASFMNNEPNYLEAFIAHDHLNPYRGSLSGRNG